MTKEYTSKSHTFHAKFVGKIFTEISVDGYKKGNSLKHLNENTVLVKKNSPLVNQTIDIKSCSHQNTKRLML